jgi:hypothetical protein
MVDGGSGYRSEGRPASDRRVVVADLLEHHGAENRRQVTLLAGRNETVGCRHDDGDRNSDRRRPRAGVVVAQRSPGSHDAGDVATTKLRRQPGAIGLERRILGRRRPQHPLNNAIARAESEARLEHAQAPPK